jgi:hypothetical protein
LGHYYGGGGGTIVPLFWDKAEFVSAFTENNFILNLLIWGGVVVLPLHGAALLGLLDF